ncbi:MAG TPA: KTSC domain-containing protein [Rhodoferax sp.]|nr:KTSC domain-containing protein [Rhodoferax sp.]
MEMIRVSSSAISAVGYEPSTQQMTIKFTQGQSYTFCRVPAAVFDGLMRSGSKGSYYDSHIKGRYRC